MDAYKKNYTKNANWDGHSGSHQSKQNPVWFGILNCLIRDNYLFICNKYYSIHEF